MYFKKWIGYLIVGGEKRYAVRKLYRVGGVGGVDICLLLVRAIELVVDVYMVRGGVVNFVRYKSWSMF